MPADLGKQNAKIWQRGTNIFKYTDKGSASGVSNLILTLYCLIKLESDHISGKYIRPPAIRALMFSDIDEIIPVVLLEPILL